MQYIKGQTLEELLAKAPQGRLSVGEVIYIGKSLCEVLVYLHAQVPPIVFRDVKPANIMHSRQGSGIYLIDFGIARRYREGQSKDTVPLGSPGYAAPEQYGKAQSTPRTDMYGLGATLQTLLTGKEPGEIQADGIPAGCDIPDELQTLITRMLEPDPEQRPAFMWTVGQSLHDLQKHYPRVPPVSPGPFAWLSTLWTLLMLAVAPLVFSNPLHLFLLPAALCWIIVITGHHFYRARRVGTSKSPRQDVRSIIKKGLASSLHMVWQVWAIGGICFSLRVLISFFDGATLIKLLIYASVSIAGLLLIGRFGQKLFRRIQRRLSVPQDEQAIQIFPMEQEIHRHL